MQNKKKTSLNNYLNRILSYIEIRYFHSKKKFLKLIFSGIEFPSHVMLGQSVSMKCNFNQKENQKVNLQNQNKIPLVVLQVRLKTDS